MCDVMYKMDWKNDFLDWSLIYTHENMGMKPF